MSSREEYKYVVFIYVSVNVPISVSMSREEYKNVVFIYVSVYVPISVSMSREEYKNVVFIYVSVYVSISVSMSREEYKNVVFIYVSDDMTWAEEKILPRIRTDDLYLAGSLIHPDIRYSYTL